MFLAWSPTKVQVLEYLNWRPGRPEQSERSGRCAPSDREVDASEGGDLARTVHGAIATDSTLASFVSKPHTAQNPPLMWFYGSKKSRHALSPHPACIAAT